MKTLFVITLTLATMLLVVAPAALADEPQAAPQTESQALTPPLPKNVLALLMKDGTLLDIVLDLSFAPAVVSAKLYFRTNDEAATAFWVQVLVDATGSAISFPNEFNENTVLGVRQINSGGAKEEWVNEPLLERLAKKLMRKQPEKEKTKYSL